MATVDMIGKQIPEYRRNVYWYNISEIDAEKAGVENAREFFQENFQEIDFDKILQSVIREEQNWYARTDFKDAEHAIRNLARAEKESVSHYTGLPIQGELSQEWMKSHSEGLVDFVSDDNRRRQYQVLSQEIGKGVEANQVLVDFIHQRSPDVIKKYPCLDDEWPDMRRISEGIRKETERRLPDISSVEDFVKKHDDTQFGGD